MKEDYLKIFKIYLYFEEKYQLCMEVSSNEELENPISKKLYYSSNSTEPEKCYFIRDLKGLRAESYGKIQKMLDDFKSGISSDVKKISRDDSVSFLELKNDQIRIILENINNNNYSVAGVFIKKSNNEHEIYQKMVDRPRAEIDDDYSQAVEDYYFDYIKNNARKGSR